MEFSFTEHSGSDNVLNLIPHFCERRKKGRKEMFYLTTH